MPHTPVARKAQHTRRPACLDSQHIVCPRPQQLRDIKLGGQPAVLAVSHKLQQAGNARMMVCGREQNKKENGRRLSWL